MGRMNFNNPQDLSGVFSSLQQRYDNKVEADVASAKRRAQEEQAAQDKEVYARWKAGEISDAEWLAHLAGRRDNALEPEERAEYAELFLEHQGAISDAQVEANFALGRVSIGQLMQHYSSRMSSVEENSPAWRDLATRYGQLSQAAVSYGSGGGSGGGGSRRRGGGGGSGGGSGSADPQAVVDAGVAAGEGSFFKGINTAGRDVLDPTVSMVPIEDDDDFINALMSDVERIKGLEEWMDAHPGDRTVIDEFSGDEFEVNSDFLLAMDKQYLRTEQALAAAYFARGTSEDVKKGNQALGHATTWVASAMTRHATVKVEPHLRQLEQHVFAQVVGASRISDPNERRKAYANALANIDDWATRNLAYRRPATAEDAETNPLSLRLTLTGVKVVEEMPDALRPDEEVFTRAENLRGLLFLGANSDRLSIEEINDMADQILSRDASIGEGGATISIKTLLEGPSQNGSTDVPDDFIGLLETMTQAQGLAAGARILAGNPDPEYDGPIYTYEYDGDGTPRAVLADVRDVPNAFGGVSPVIVPQGGEPDDLVMARVKIGGSTQTVWIKPQPLDDPRFRVYRDKDDNLLTSAQLAELGPARIRSLVAKGALQVDSVMSAVQMPDGNVWFKDEETGLFHLEAPFTVDRDPTTNGVRVDDEGEPVMNPVPFSKGVIVPFAGVRLQEMGRWLREASQMGIINPSAYRQRGPGGTVVDIDLLNDLNTMYEPQREPGQRLANPRMREHLRARARSSEEEFMRSHLYARQQQAPTTQQELAVRNSERTRTAARDLGLEVGGIKVPDARPTGGVFSDGVSAGPLLLPVAATGGPAGFVSGLLSNLFGANPRNDAAEAMISRNVQKKRMNPVALAIPKRLPVEEFDPAPPVVTRAPLPLLRTQPIDLPPATKVRLPTNDTPSLLGSKSPQQRANGNQEIL